MRALFGFAALVIVSLGYVPVALVGQEAGREKADLQPHQHDENRFAKGSRQRGETLYRQNCVARALHGAFAPGRH